MFIVMQFADDVRLHMKTQISNSKNNVIMSIYASLSNLYNVVLSHCTCGYDGFSLFRNACSKQQGESDPMIELTSEVSPEDKIASHSYTVRLRNLNNSED